MAYFPKFGPFYDPKNEQEIYGERDGRLRLRQAQKESRAVVENGLNHRQDRGQNNPLHDERSSNSDWTGFLQNHGNLFYMESTKHAYRNHNVQMAAATKRDEYINNHSRQSSNSSDRNNSPRVINQGNMKQSRLGAGMERQSSADNESLGSSGSSYLNERHHFDRGINSRFSREDRQRCSDGSSQSDQSYTTFSEYLDASNGLPKTSQKRQGQITPNQGQVTPNLKGTNSKLSQMSVNQNQSGKRKSVVMVPNVKNVDNIHGCTGVYLCEKLFGIKLCNYKDKPPRPNGSSVEQILRDRKVIVQGVVQDSQADICNQIHRGDMLVGINDVGVTWVNIDELIRSMSQQSKVKLTFQVPLVIGPKQATPPVTPTRNSTPPLPHHTDQSRHIPPPVPPHIPLLAQQQAPTIPPRHPQHVQYRSKQKLHDLVHLTTGETVMSLDNLLKKYLFCVMYITFGNQTDGSKPFLLGTSKPVPPHIPLQAQLQAPTIPPRHPQHVQYRSKQKLHDLVHLTTGETVMSLDNLLKKHQFCVMYLTFGNQTDGSKDDIVYQYPTEDNKLVEIRGLFVTLTAMMKDVTNNYPKLTSVRYRGQTVHTVYWRHNQDVVVYCLPENRVPAKLLLQIFTDFIHILEWQHGSVSRVFEDPDLHGQLDQLISLVLYRVLLTGVGNQSIPHCSPLEPQLLDMLAGIRELNLATDDKVFVDIYMSNVKLLTGVGNQSIPHCSPLEPQLLDMLAGIRELNLATDDKILCDEILSEFEAQDYMELEDVDPDLRRKFGIIGSCLFYKDYLLCSHLNDQDLQDIHLYLKYHAILYLVNKQPVEDLVLWREIYPSRLCSHTKETPAYKEPKGRCFMLVVGMRHFVHCTILESGGYASQIKGQVDVDPFFLEQSKLTLAQLITDDTDIEQQCNERLFSDFHGPKLKSIDNAQLRRDSTQVKSPASKSDGSPRYGVEDMDRLSVNSPEVINRQGSRMSHSSNDSYGSSGSAGLNKNAALHKKGSMYDVSLVNRSFTDSHHSCNLKVTRSSHNLLLHYVSFDKLNGVYVSPTPCDLSSVQGPTHQHVLYNFYGCCVRIHKQFECVRHKQEKNNVESEINSGRALEEAVMFTCPISQQDARRPASVLMYWVIGRLFSDNRELFVCIEDGAPQSLLELAFTYQFGLS